MVCFVASLGVQVNTSVLIDGEVVRFADYRWAFSGGFRGGYWLDLRLWMKLLPDTESLVGASRHKVLLARVQRDGERTVLMPSELAMKSDGPNISQNAASAALNAKQRKVPGKLIRGRA